MRLTDLTIPKLRPGVYMDDRTPGFGVRIGKNRRTFIAVVGRGRVKTTVGHFPALKVADARKEALRLTLTPQEQKPEAISFEKARDAFLDHYDNPRTRRAVEYTLKGHCKALEGVSLTDLTTEALEAVLGRIRAPSARLHTFRYLRALLRWCQRSPRRWLKHSPLEGYEPPGTDKRGTRVLSDEELYRIWYCSPPIFRLMILWGTRNTETCLLQREWERDGVLTIPGKHTKNGRDHAIPILPLARHILDSTGTDNCVFPGRWDGHLTHHALPKLKREVMEKSGTSGWQLRDMRRTFRSNMARLGVPREIAEVLINHAPPVLDDIYDKYDRLAEKRAALAKYEAALVWLLARA
jgi:integrase